MKLKFIGAAVLALACSGTTSPRDGLIVTTDVHPAVMRVGDTATVTVSIRNTGFRTVTVARSRYPGYQFMVTTVTGEPVGPVGYYLSRRDGTAVVPGETLTLTYRWDGSVSRAADPSGVIAPGSYLVYGRVNVGHFAMGDPVPLTVTD